MPVNLPNFLCQKIWDSNRSLLSARWAPFVVAAIFCLLLPLAQADDKAAQPNATPPNSQQSMRNLPDSYWKQKLPLHIYSVTRCSATEPPFTGKYWNNHESGQYRCSNCGVMLFESKDKFDSGTGWPSFTQAQKNSVEQRPDHSQGMTREEIVCKHCGAHLGHVFDDGPAPTGKRFCVNSASLDFKKQVKK